MWICGYEAKWSLYPSTHRLPPLHRLYPAPDLPMHLVPKSFRWQHLWIILRKIIGKHIGNKSGIFWSLCCKFMEMICLKAPKNYSAPIWYNSPGLCPGRVRSPTMRFWHRLFPLFRFFFVTANPSSHFRAIFRNQSHGHEFEQHFELELLFLVRKVRTRGGVSGSHRTGRFPVEGLLLWKRFSERFVSEKWCQLELQMAPKI